MSSRRFAPLLALMVPAAVLVAACGPKSDPDRQAVVVTDQGLVCVGAQDADAGEDRRAVIKAFEPLRVDVKSRGCLAYDCVADRRAKCTVDQSGDRLTVKSDLSWTAPTEISRHACSGDCGPIDAHCESSPLVPGHYTVILGKEEMGIDVPSEREWACLNPVVPYTPRPPEVVRDAGVDAGATPAPASHLVELVSAPVPPPARARTSVCWGPVGKKPGVTKGQPLRVRVQRQNLCKNFTCAGGPAHCTTKRTGSRIVVNAEFPRDGQKPTRPCTEECPPIVANCKVEGLPAGLYQLEVADEHHSFEIPSRTQPACPP